MRKSIYQPEIIFQIDRSVREAREQVERLGEEETIDRCSFIFSNIAVFTTNILLFLKAQGFYGAIVPDLAQTKPILEWGRVQDGWNVRKSHSCQSFSTWLHTTALAYAQFLPGPKRSVGARHRAGGIEFAQQPSHPSEVLHSTPTFHDCISFLKVCLYPTLLKNHTFLFTIPGFRCRSSLMKMYLEFGVHSDEIPSEKSWSVARRASIVLRTAERNLYLKLSWFDLRHSSPFGIENVTFQS